MIWHVVLVISLPIVGGIVLDKYYHKTPILLVAGNNLL
jgi:hypothetical protein